MTIAAQRGRIGLCVQCGNIARAMYDLTKLQALHAAGEIDAAVIVVPTRDAARVLGSNLADFARLLRELPFLGVLLKKEQDVELLRAMKR